MDEVLTVEFIGRIPLSSQSPRRTKLDRNHHVTFIEPINYGSTAEQECKSNGTVSHALFIDSDNVSNHDVLDDDHFIPVISIEKRSPFNIQSHENPFVADSELQHKADYILEHSTINRTTIIIVDPDAVGENGVAEDIVQSSSAGTQQSAPHSDGHVNNVTVAEVRVTKSAVAEPQHAEEVKLKEKGKCCVVI